MSEYPPRLNPGLLYPEQTKTGADNVRPRPGF